jgi:hypothetical protein
MAAFEIVTFVGALPLKFGMRIDEVSAVLGNPDSKHDRKGVVQWNFHRGDASGVNVRFGGTEGTLDHIGFGKYAHVHFAGINFFEDLDAWKALLKQSQDYHLTYGFLVFCDLGIALTGFHDGDMNQLAVTAFPRGAWERSRPRFEPFRPPGHLENTPNHVPDPASPFVTPPAVAGGAPSVAADH